LGIIDETKTAKEDPTRRKKRARKVRRKTISREKDVVAAWKPPQRNGAWGAGDFRKSNPEGEKGGKVGSKNQRSLLDFKEKATYAHN